MNRLADRDRVRLQSVDIRSDGVAGGFSISAQERNTDLDSIRSVSPESTLPEHGTPEQALQRLEDIIMGSSAMSNRHRRSVFPFHSRRGVSQQAIMRHRERPMQPFHRVLSPLFSGIQSRSSPSRSGTIDKAESLQSDGSSSSSSRGLTIPDTSGAHNGVGWSDVMPGIRHSSDTSLESVPPGALLFSSPSPRSSDAHSDCGNDSYYGSDSASLRAASVVALTAHSTSPSDVADGALGDFLLEPHAGAGIPRGISETILHHDSVPDTIVEPSTACGPWRRGHGMLGNLSDELQAPEQPYPATCKEWSVALGALPPPKGSRATALPSEIIQQIYGSISPTDFNAARHTCRRWMLASLDRSLLVVMLKRGGWWGGAEADLLLRTSASDGGTQSLVTEEWFLSRRISRECALGPAWTGNGLQVGPESAEATESRGPKALIRTACTDFTDLSSGHAGSGGRCRGGLIFTVSVCGRFVLVAEGGMIYVYQLDASELLPITSVVCPRRVLAMSMDASSRRFAVAALLDGRMGLVCELQVGHDYEGSASSADVVGGVCHGNESRTSCFTNTLCPANDPTAGRGSSVQVETPNLDIRSEDHDTLTFSAISVQNDTRATSLHQTTNPVHHERNLINQTWNLRLRGTRCFPAARHHPSSGAPPHLETGPRSLYRHLCSDEDPPRSVAICPQRRCVAFGCSAGVELHWVDALTGQDLNRWFPLTAPSDHLYFLPARAGVDSARKLRLISSAGHPSERPAIARKFSAARPALSAFWNTVGLQVRGRPVTSTGERECDHFRAVPLSDGSHILFTDPETGLLCLGSDAPFGRSVKLLRKFMFVPPAVLLGEAPGGDAPQPLPRIYAAGAELRWGVRVAVAYGDTVVLFSVPPDPLAFSRREMGSPIQGAPGKQEDAEVLCLQWWPDPDRPAGPDYPTRRLEPVWPLKIRGSVIGSLGGLVDLAVGCEPELTIWAFGLDGRAVTWCVDGGGGPLAVVERTVGSDGRVVGTAETDGEGDGPLTHAGDAVDGGGRSVGFDGDAPTVLMRVPGAFSVGRDRDVEMLDVPPGAWYDEEGDLVMLDASACG